MDLTEALRTTGAAREFTDEPVTDELLAELLDVARFAPSGGNRQPWHVAVVQDRPLRRRLADLCAPVWSTYVAIGATGATPFNAIGSAPEPTDPAPTPNPLLDAVERVPVVLVVAADLERVAMLDKDLDRAPITGGASVYPFVWSLLLAARARGLGGVMTTFLARAELEAGPLLGLPDTWAVASMVCIGHPVHQPTRLSRGPVEGFATVDRFDGPVFGARCDRRGWHARAMTAAIDHPDAHRFELTEDGHLAELVYRLDGDRLVLTHTGVPEELGGRGLGGVLVAAAVERAAAEGLTLVPECPFARSWLERHPDDASGVKIDWPAQA